MAHNATSGAVSFAGEKCRSSGGADIRPLRSASVDVAAAAARRAPSSTIRTSSTNVSTNDVVFAVPTHPAPRTRPSIIRRTAVQKHKKPQAGAMPPPSLSKQAYMEKMGNEKAVELEELHRRNQMLENLLAALRASDGSSAMRHKLVEVPGCSLDMRTGRLRVLGDLVELADNRQHQTSTPEPTVSQKASRPPPVPVIEGK